MPEFIQVNINITEEDSQLLDSMIAEDGYDNRSAWFRRIVRKEYETRQAKKRPEFPAVTSYPPVLIPLDPQAGESISNPNQNS